MYRVLLTSLVFAQTMVMGVGLSVENAVEQRTDHLFSSQLQTALNSPCLSCISGSAIYHAISSQGASVQLDDGSVWAIAPGHEVIVSQWGPEDEVFVKPYESCFTSYHYTLFNANLAQTVKVNLLDPPVVGSEHTFTIKAFCYEHRLVMLSDNSIWYIGTEDDSYLEWNLGNRIIVGANNHLCEADCPQILVNADITGSPYCLVCFVQ